MRSSRGDDFRRELDLRQRDGTTPDQIEITHYGDGTTLYDRALEEYLNARSDVEREAAAGVHLHREVPPARSM